MVQPSSGIWLMLALGALVAVGALSIPGLPGLLLLLGVIILGMSLIRFAVLASENPGSRRGRRRSHREGPHQR